MLETCRKSRDRAQALQLYACMPVCVVTDHAKITNQLVSVLVDARSIQHARHVFDRLSHRDASAWSSLIIGYVRHEEWQHALTLYQSMQKETSLHPSDYAFVCLLKACTGLKDLEMGSELHETIASEGLLKANLYIGSALIEMYAKCGSLSKAPRSPS
ncbi:hypothetical protein GOP47_0018263 [Adiantum capillus-veneris]|uniref:Pentatricopeptide repeat-containing protein n=1 Tax=Adiantum capillus-veneris TaxID=13818 RepID=A0A9D4ZBP6_ADICA|nr:hypothetical protein GOP47_0018263 [Adiantum capillus-veneris]